MKWKKKMKDMENIWKELLFLEQVTAEARANSERWSAPVPGGHGWRAAGALEEGRQEQ